MTQFVKEIEIQAPPEKVWKALADFGKICHASPDIRTSHVTSDKKEGVGATRHCDLTRMNATLEERVTEWVEGKSIKIDVYEIRKMPGIASMSARFEIRPTGTGTMLQGTVAYGMKNGFFDFLNAILMKGMNEKSWTGVMAGHKKYIETGVQVTDKTPLEIDKVVHLSAS